MRQQSTIVLTLFLLGISLPQAFSETQKAVALLGGTVYPSPTETPVMNGVVLIRDGRIVEVGSVKEVKIPANSEIVRCDGMFLMERIPYCSHESECDVDDPYAETIWRRTLYEIHFERS